MSMAVSKIHLIRHGKQLLMNSAYTADMRMCRCQAMGAELLAFKNQNVYPSNADLYFTSGLLRTEETLDLLYGKVKRQIFPQLRELNFGGFEMKSHDDLVSDPDYQKWISDKTNLVRCPGGESKNEFLERVIAGYKQIEKGSESKLIICHGGVIVSIMEFLFPARRNFYEWQPNPGRGYTIMYASDLPEYKLI